MNYILFSLDGTSIDNYTLEENKLQITEHMFERDALIFDDYQIEKIGLVYPDGTPYITMECKDIPSIGIWSKPEDETPFICLEPWIGRCDNPGFNGELKDKCYEQSLEVGGTFKAQYTLTLG